MFLNSSRRPAPFRVRPKHERLEPGKPVAKLPQRANKPIQKLNTPEVKPETREEKKRERSPLAAGDGHYELSPLMTCMVEAELQDIMIKVWQELPDHPPDVAEELVVDKFRNKAGDDLRNALGLNITKRLLNVHNPLYVKIQFTGKPEKAHLSAFLKKYNFNAFKRIESTVNTFAAQVRTIADFDRICAARDIRCGTIKVTVNPCYRFTKCPANLRTCFNDNEEDKEKDMDLKEIYGVEDKQTDTQPNDAKHSEEITTDEVENVPKGKSNTLEEQKTEVKPSEKPIINVAPAPKPKASQAKVEATPEKISPVVDAKTDTTQNITPAKTAKEETTQLSVKNDSQVRATTAKVTEKVITPVETAKDTTNQLTIKNDTQVGVKTAAGNQKVITTVQESKGNDVPVKKLLNAKNATHKIEAKTVTPPSPKFTQIKVVKGNVAVSKPRLQAKRVEKKVEKVEDDYDELDDHDILALMSEGIVLDECSGSDDE